MTDKRFITAYSKPCELSLTTAIAKQGPKNKHKFDIEHKLIVSWM